MKYEKMILHISIKKKNIQLTELEMTNELSALRHYQAW